MIAFWPSMTTGSGETVVQSAETRFVVDCKVNPAALVGQVKIIFTPEGISVSCGGVTGNEMLNTVPLPELPPPAAVPYSVLLDKILSCVVALNRGDDRVGRASRLPRSAKRTTDFVSRSRSRALWAGETRAYVVVHRYVWFHKLVWL